jgi:hypothetical protein
MLRKCSPIVRELGEAARRDHRHATASKISRMPMKKLGRAAPLTATP